MSLGKILKETRIKRGISLTDVSRELLIKEAYLEAIEDGIDERLPSETYKRIYTRAYCRFLGVEFKETQQTSEETSKVVSNAVSVKKNPAEKDRPKVMEKKPQPSINSSNDLELDIPFDFNRACRIFAKIMGTILIIYLIVKFFQWIF